MVNFMDSDVFVENQICKVLISNIYEIFEIS